MFDGDKWTEILYSLGQNPLRTCMIVLAVAIGMFILVVLQGMGSGLQTGVESQFADDAVNSIWVRSSRTSMSYGGFQPNRTIQFKEEDHHIVAEDIQGTTVSSGRLQFWGTQVVVGDKYGNYSLRCVDPEHQELERTELSHGRFINDLDLAERRKVLVLGQTIVDEIFGGRNPVGEFMQVWGIQFRVVGTFNDPASRWENRQMYAPITTGQFLFGGNNDDIGMFMLSTSNDGLETTVQTAEAIDGFLRARHTVHPDDMRGISVSNNNEEFQRFANIILGMKVFLFFIGGLTLVFGIIGVSTIMSIVVKDRTREFGVRKSLGATPASILNLIVMEAVLITLLSGMVGLVAGVLVLELVATFVDHEFFSNPRLSLGVCLLAMAILVVSGIFAGLVPGLRAARIKPVEALKED